ncbi:hypothetical protein [Azospirillum soli]|uniref:hypothetical protein n=1 Tax=Azospirillum soli TaxID=1304799 RepID=UPI001AEB47C0|nr:hypothetical protein [Azospirillum soli]MBP2311113.1 hypothetical protein [Azospirillum soli]
MRVLVMTATAALLALPVGALAQSTTANPSAAPSATPMDQNSAGTVGGRFHGSNAMNQDQLRKSLEQAGFTNVRVLDSAYLVQAQGANGETVTMMIDSSGSMASGSSSGGMMGGGMMGGGMSGGGMMGGTGSAGGTGNSATTGTGPGGSMGTSSGTTTGGTTTTK